LNIVLTTDYFPPHIGGVEKVTYELANQLCRMGHRVAVCTLGHESTKSIENSDGVRVYTARSHESTGILGVQSAFSSVAGRLIRSVCKKERADVIHSNNLYYLTTIAASASKKGLNLPLVTTLHIGTTARLDVGIRFLTMAYERSIGKWILDQSDHIIAVSSAVKEYARGLNVSESKISVIPNGIDVSEIRPNHFHQRKANLRIAFVGRLIANKGPQYLLETAPTVLREFPEVEFLFVGDGPLQGLLRRSAKTLGISERVRFLPAVPSIPEFLRECDIYVRPSLTEGMPLTVLEAMASGVPTIATSIEGTREIITHGENGFLIAPKSAEQLKFYISKLVSDPELRIKMGKRARETMEKHNDWATVAVQTSRVYENVLSQHRKDSSRTNPARKAGFVISTAPQRIKNTPICV